MLPSGARELKQLRDETAKPETARRRPVARQGHAAGRRSKKVLKPVKQREVMRYLVGRYDVSTRRACGVIKATRSSAYYRSRKDPLTALRQRLRALAQARVLFGYRRLRVLLLREGWASVRSASMACTPRRFFRFTQNYQRCRVPGAKTALCVCRGARPAGTGSPSRTAPRWMNALLQWCLRPHLPARRGRTVHRRNPGFRSMFCLRFLPDATSL